MIGRVVVIVACAAAAAGAQDPVAPKLSGDVPQPAAREEAPAQPVPSVVTICIDHAARRCWTAAGESGCEQVFATVPAGSPDVGSRLRACSESVE